MEVLHKTQEALTALEIAKETGKVEKPVAKLVNPILYKLESKGKVKKSTSKTSTKPTWTIAERTGLAHSDHRSTVSAGSHGNDSCKCSRSSVTGQGN